MSAPVIPAQLRLYGLLFKVGLVVALFDVCFWKVQGLGLSEAAFFGGLLALLLVGAPVRYRFLAALLGLGALAAGAVAPGFSNTATWLMLVIWVAGTSARSGIESPLGKMVVQVFALLIAPGRLVWVAVALSDRALRGGTTVSRKLSRLLAITLPALFLALIFMWLLGQGNAVFGAWTDSSISVLGTWLEHLINVWRLALWIFISGLALALFRPSGRSLLCWPVVSGFLPAVGRDIPARLTLISSLVALGAMNLIFFAANLADALFLWRGLALPAGVSFSQFVHEGVNALVATVLLSAVVLVGIFHCVAGASRSRLLGSLALLWIGQNLFLVLSTGLRLWNYIEACDMTVPRLGVIIFLALVAICFGLLTVKILCHRRLLWLLSSCLFALFITLYIVQFLNLAGWVANYNVEQCVRDTSRRVDNLYLLRLGPAAWPAIRRMHDSNLMLTFENRWHVYDENINLARWDADHWREFQLRAWLNRTAYLPNEY